MHVKLFAAFLLAGHLSLSIPQEVSPPAVPLSLDNFGGDVSDYSIMYTKNLQDVMRKFNIPRAEMEEMLRTYVAGGQPKITRTVFNPDTNLNETITLDFKSFEEDSAASRQSAGTSTDKVDVVFKPNQRGSDSGAQMSMSNFPQVRETGLPSISDLRRPPSAVDDPLNPSPSMDLTAMRENEAKLIEDLKLLQRRRDALDESFTRKEIDEETYRLNVETNELQMRDAYMVLQQIQDAIREFLGIPPQGQSAAANRMGGGSIGTPMESGIMPSDSQLRTDQDTLNRFQDSQLSSQQFLTGGETLSPEDELAMIRQELDRLRTMDAGIQNELSRLRMPIDDSSIPDTTNAFSNGVDNFGSMVDPSLPTPPPVPAVSGFSSRAPSLLPPSVPGTNLPIGRTSPTSDSGVRDYMNNLINEYVRLNRRETDILQMLDDSNTLQTMGNSGGTRLQNSGLNLGLPQARRVNEQIVTRSDRRDDSISGPNRADPDNLPTLPENLRYNAMDDTNRIDTNEALNSAPLSTNSRLINNLLSEYNKLNQREIEIQRILDNQSDQNTVGRNDIFDINQPQPRRDLGRSVDLGENTDTFAVGTDLSQDFQNLPTENLLETLRPGARGLRGSIDNFLGPDSRQFDRAPVQPIIPDARVFDRTLDQTLRRDARGFDRTFDQTLRRDARGFDRGLDQTVRPDVRMLGENLRPDGRYLERLFDQSSRPGSSTFSNFRPLSTGRRTPLSQAFDLNGVTSTDRSGLFTNVRPLGRSTRLSGASDFDDSTSNTIQDTRPTPATSSALGRRADESLASPTADSSNDNLVYDDGTITIESVRPAGSYDEGDAATPLETGPGSEFPVSGFSSRASGLLTPGLDSLSLQNRIDPRLGRGRVNTFMRRSLYPFFRNRRLQSPMRRSPIRQAVF